MKITLLVVGKTATSYLRQGIDDYAARIAHYAPFGIDYVADIKNSRKLSPDQQKAAEGKLILAAIDRSDYVVLLDERGKEFTSTLFTEQIKRRMLSGVKRLVFVVGGPYGFSSEVYDRANEKMSLSQMTLPHELVRLIFTEQLYRAFTILNHEPYHHD